MTNKPINQLVDQFIASTTQWQKEYQALRTIITEFPLVEELKWGVPCYTLNDKNVLLVHGFKEYCAILFVKGSLIDDHHNALIQQTLNVQAGRQLRFKHLESIHQQLDIIKEYITQAIEIEQQGLQVNLKPVDEYTLPTELIEVFDSNPAFKSAFESLTPGRQRGYLLFFSQPKQSKTRSQRIDKYMPKIFDRKGLDD